MPAAGQDRCAFVYDRPPDNIPVARTRSSGDKAMPPSWCSADAVREFRPSERIGSYVYFCVKPAHAPNGGWVQGSNLYVLEVGTPDVDYGTTRDRETEFEAVASAISKNVGR
jgi:hypothetical protein